MPQRLSQATQRRIVSLSLSPFTVQVSWNYDTIMHSLLSRSFIGKQCGIFVFSWFSTAGNSLYKLGLHWECKASTKTKLFTHLYSRSLDNHRVQFPFSGRGKGSGSENKKSSQIVVSCEPDVGHILLQNNETKKDASKPSPDIVQGQARMTETYLIVPADFQLGNTQITAAGPIQVAAPLR